MQGGTRVGALLRQAGAAAIYLIALMLFRQVSIPHWIILTGFHLAVLMLVPYRYWPALFVGDFARLAYVSYTCLDQFGPLWAGVNLIPSIAYEAPVVWLFRERWNLFPSKSQVNMLALVLCSFIVAVIATTITIGQVLLSPLPPGYVLHYGEVIARLMLGNFMGVLTIVPIALVWQLSFLASGNHWRQWFHDLMESRLFLESVFVVVPTLVFFGWLGWTDAHARAVAQMAMFLPVVVMAMRHGWKGAAAAGTLASVSIVLLMPAKNDHATLQAETLVAMAITTMLLVGARIALLDRRAEQERSDMRSAMALARRNAYLGEAQLRVASQAVEQLRDSIQFVYTVMLGRLRQLQPVIDDTGYRRQAANTQEQLFRVTDTLYPILLRERGLHAALVHGALARMLSEAHIRYWCDLRGPVSQFPPGMALAAYRVISEAIAETCFRRDVGDILVKVRCGTRGRPWMVLMVESRNNPAVVQHVDWDQLVPRIRVSASGVGRKAIEDRAATFEGTVRERELRKGRRIIVSLLQPIHPHD